MLAELCVGRIIRARNDPSGALALAVLTRALGFWLSFDAAGSEVLGVNLRALDNGAARSLPSTAGLRPLFTLERLGDREGGASPNLAADEAVVAVAAAGKRTERVGDFGRAFVMGEIGPRFFAESPLGAETPFSDLVPAASGTLVPTDSRLVLATGSFLGSRFVCFGAVEGPDCLGDAVFDGACLPATFGEFGVFGDPAEISFEAVAADFGALTEGFFELIADGLDEPGFALGFEVGFAAASGLDGLLDTSGFNSLGCLGGDDVLSG